MTNNEAISIIKTHCYEFNLLDLDECSIVNSALDKAIQSLENDIPASGYWEYVCYDSVKNIGNYHCSNCRFITHENLYRFCPGCGCKMKNSTDW